MSATAREPRRRGLSEGAGISFQQNDLLYGQVRIEVLPILFINGKLQRTFVWDPGVDLGLGGLQNIWEYQINIELGWQW